MTIPIYTSCTFIYLIYIIPFLKLINSIRNIILLLNIYIYKGITLGLYIIGN